MAEIAEERPVLTRRLVVEPLSRLTTTLADYYARKRERYLVAPPTIYDRDLQRIFSGNPRRMSAPAASRFIRQHRAEIRELVSQWTGEYQLALDQVLDAMIARCRALRLRAVGSERALVMNFAVLLTAKTVHALYSRSRRQRFAL